MLDLKTTFGLKYKPDVLSTLSASQRVVKHSLKMMIIVLGDNNKYWVVCPADAQKLQQNGYEVIK